MFRTSTAVAAVALLGFPGAAAAAEADDDTVQLSLGETLSLVESENLQVLLNREVMEQAIQAAERERSFLLPQVDVQATQTRSKFSTAGQAFEAPQSTRNRFDARIRGDLTLVDPALIASYQAARKGVRISQEEHEAVLQDVLQASARIYLTHLRNIRRFEVIESNIERAQSLLELAQAQLDAGVATEIDLTRARVQLAGERQSRLQQETVVYESALNLKRLLDLDLRKEIELDDFVAHREAASEEPEVEERDVLRDRAEYRTAERRLEQNKLEQRAASWERFPTLSVFGDYGYASGNAFDGDDQEVWSAGVAVRVPVFEGFRIRSNRMLANSRRRATEIEIRDLEQEISSELLFAWQDLRSRLAQIEVAEENLELAEDELRLAQVRFEQGVADNREVIDAQNRVSQASDNLVEAFFGYNVSRLEYARVRGDVRLLLGDQVL